MIYRWKGMDVYFLLVFTEWNFDVCKKSYGQLSDQRSETDNNRVALFWLYLEILKPIQTVMKYYE